MHEFTIALSHQENDVATIKLQIDKLVVLQNGKIVKTPSKIR